MPLYEGKHNAENRIAIGDRIEEQWLSEQIR